MADLHVTEATPSMTMQRVRPSAEWMIEELLHLSRQRPEWVQDVLGRLLEEDEELRWALVVQAYLDRRINLGKAAELLGIHELALREQFLHLGIPLRLGPADVEEAKAEVEVLRTWLMDSSKDASAQEPEDPGRENE